MVGFLENLIGSDIGFFYCFETLNIQWSRIDIDTPDFTMVFFYVIDRFNRLGNKFGRIGVMFTKNENKSFLPMLFQSLYIGDKFIFCKRFSDCFFIRCLEPTIAAVV